MKILLTYLEEDEKLNNCLNSLKKYSPDVQVVTIKADPNKTKISEEVFLNYLKDGNDDDIMIWHPDMLATEGWFEDLMYWYDEFDVIGCKILYPNGIVNHYGGAIAANGIGFHPHQFSINIGLNKPLDTAFVTGPGMLIKAKVLDKIKWDLSFQHYIDVDFCFQAREAGFKVGVVPVTLIHLEGEDGFKKRDPKVQNEMLKTYHDKFVAKWMHRLNYENQS